MPDPVILKRIGHCARCGGAHENLPMRAFTSPPAGLWIEGQPVTHWIMCPSLVEPILLAGTIPAIVPGVIHVQPV